MKFRRAAGRIATAPDAYDKPGAISLEHHSEGLRLYSLRRLYGPD